MVQLLCVCMFVNKRRYESEKEYIQIDRRIPFQYIDLTSPPITLLRACRHFPNDCFE